MIYIDTSVAVPLFVPEPSSTAVDAWFASCNEPMVSSDWILTEFASVLSIKVRQGEMDRKRARAAWKDFAAFCRSGLRLFPVSRNAFGQAVRLVRDARSSLRAGDALHLAMALEAGAAGVATADANLAQNAMASGLAVHRL